jgi:hypothetical protein
MTEIFFIVGLGRSATSSLAQAIGRHPRLAIAAGSSFALDLQRQYGDVRWTRERIAAFCRDLSRQAGIAAWQLDMKRLAARLYVREASLSYAEVCRQVYVSYAEDRLGRDAPAWVGDHTPAHALAVGRLDRIFPQARFIHVTRDYRDQIYEQIRSIAAEAGPHAGARRAAPRLLAWLPAWVNLSPPAALAQRWKEYNQRILALSRHAPERSLWLRHEDLLAYPEHELTRVCRFLDLAFDVRLLTPDLLPAADAPRRSSRGPSWQQLPEAELRRIEAICGEFGERFGYRSTVRGGSSLSLSTRLLTWYGTTSVIAESLAARLLPAPLRRGVSGAYRSVAGRLQAGRVASETLP